MMKNVLRKLKWIGLIYFSINGILLFSQTSYPFINYAEANLKMPKDSSLMLNFFRKMDDLKEGKRLHVKIVHYGGSHVQGGFWSSALHANFQKLNQTEGGGAFAFPYKLAKTNSPPFYRSFGNGKWIRARCVRNEICTELGMCGMAIVTNDSVAGFGMRLTKNEHTKDFHVIRVYHNFNPSFHFNVVSHNPGAYERRDLKPQGFTQFFFKEAVDSIAFEVVRDDTINKDFALSGFDLINEKPGYYFAPMGVNGASTESYLRCKMFVQQLKTIQPDLVILSLGVNDSQGKNFTAENYMANYDSLLSMIKEASPNTAIIFTTTSDNYIKRKSPNKKSITIEQATYKLAEKHKAAVWDLFAVMGGYKSIFKWYKAGLAQRDKVHFNAKGYRLIADLMFNGIYQSYSHNSRFKGPK